MEKDKLRSELLRKLSLLSNDEVLALNFLLTDQIIKFLNSFPELPGQLGAAYLPLKAEIAPVYQELLHSVPVNLAYPAMVDGLMAFGIPQGIPKGQVWLNPPYAKVEPQWLFVPGVGFDLNGARLGRGRGYYDRYLQDHDTLKIGLAWSGQIVKTIPVERHDCHMDFIITESFCWDVKQQKRF